MPPLAEGNELFADRAARVGYAPLAVDAAAVSELCRRVGGSPLAIELLAAWAHVKSPVELLAGQSEELATRTLTVQPRHRDIAAVLDASMALLSPTSSVYSRRLEYLPAASRLTQPNRSPRPISARSQSWSSAA